MPSTMKVLSGFNVTPSRSQLLNQWARSGSPASLPFDLLTLHSRITNEYGNFGKITSLNNRLYLLPRCTSMVDWSKSQSNGVPKKTMSGTSVRRKVRRRSRKATKNNDDMRIQKVINGQVKYFRIRRVVRT